MLRCYANDHQQGWSVCASAFTFAYKEKSYIVLQALAPLIWWSDGVSQTQIEFYSVFWKNVYHRWCRWWIPSFTTARIESWLRLATTHLKALQKRFQPASLYGLWKDKGWRLCAYWCSGRCHQATKFGLFSQRPSLSAGVEPAHSVRLLKRARLKDHRLRGRTRPLVSWRATNTASVGFSEQYFEREFGKNLDVLWNFEP